MDKITITISPEQLLYIDIIIDIEQLVNYIRQKGPNFDLLEKTRITNNTDLKKVYKAIWKHDRYPYTYLIDVFKNSKDLDERILKYGYKFLYDEPQMFTKECILNTLNVAPWDLYKITNLPWFDINIVVDHIHLDWNWNRLTGWAIIHNISFIYHNPELPWVYDCYIREFYDKETFDLYYLSTSLSTIKESKKEKTNVVTKNYNFISDDED